MANLSALMDPTVEKILVVDDDPTILSVLNEQLQPEGLNATFVDSATKALEVLKRERFSIILADHEMPGMTGLELLAKVRDSNPEAIRLVLSSKLVVKELLDAVESGVIHRYLTKPWLREELLVVLRNSVARRVSESPLKVSGGTAAPAAEAGEDSASAEAATAPEGGIVTREQADIAVDAFVKMLGTFHPNLGSTALRAMALCRTIGQGFELPPDQADTLIWAAGLHDVALVGLERGVVRRWLRSPDNCAPEEMAAIRKHPKESEEMLREHPILKDAGEIIRSHHENWDGTGYPDRLKGETIPWLARLLAAAIYYCSRHQPPSEVLKDVESRVDKMFDTKAFAVIAKAVPLTQFPRSEREILLKELQPGMVLARDICNASGVPLIAKGKELTTALVNKISTINSVTPLNPYVLVYC